MGQAQGRILLYSRLGWQPLGPRSLLVAVLRGRGCGFLNAIEDDPAYEQWYRRIWNFVAARYIDRDNGGWRAQLDDALRPGTGPFFGKVDIYHSLQACLIPTLPTTGSITRGLLQTISD